MPLSYWYVVTVVWFAADGCSHCNCIHCEVGSAWRPRHVSEPVIRSTSAVAQLPTGVAQLCKAVQWQSRTTEYSLESWCAVLIAVYHFTKLQWLLLCGLQSGVKDLKVDQRKHKERFGKRPSGSATKRGGLLWMDHSKWRKLGKDC